MGVTSWATCLLREEVARSSSHFSFFSTESFTYSLTEAPPPINSTLITTISSLWKAYIYTTIEHEDIQQIVPKYENAKTTTQSGKQWNKLNNIPLFFNLRESHYFVVHLTWNTKSTNVQKFLPLEWFPSCYRWLIWVLNALPQQDGYFTVSQWARFEKVDSQRGYLISRTGDGFFP